MRNWLRPPKLTPKERRSHEDSVVDDALKLLDSDELEALGLNPSQLVTGELPGQERQEQDLDNVDDDKPPVCERCHNLIHHRASGATTNIPMFHPTVDALRETIEESPYKYNHIYHVIDAADFPMSLIPRLNVLLGDIPLRSRNRRSRASKYTKDRKVEMSFIITRGDLLGPTKEKVDRMMPYLQDVMRDALGRIGGRIRLGNLRCVSAKRSWWTNQLKEDIWRRGGAGWMVGKVNVGKSQLFEAVYPKGRVSPTRPADGKTTSMDSKNAGGAAAEPLDDIAEMDDAEELDVADLLPPPRPVTQYPEMPVVSDLPGTTASPIRVPFGNKKGELIDLPGLARGDLELFVKPEHRKSLIMKSRIVPEQQSLDSTDSLLLGGGLIRITPRTPNLTFLMYNFTPLREHLTSTQKATEFQNQTRESPAVENITLPGKGDEMKHAGTFNLRYDVTRNRAGPLTRKNAVGMKPDKLPFRVLSVDILIEGVGYVEIVAQVRAKDLVVRKPPPEELSEPASDAAPEEEPAADKEDNKDPFAVMMSHRRDERATPRKTQVRSRPVRQEPEPEPEWPAIDVFSPEGRFIGSRRPLEGWLNNKPLVRPEHKKTRPRRSMRGQKKKAKLESRAAATA